jgi:hypothetical protein
MIVAYIYVAADMGCYSGDAWGRACGKAAREGVKGRVTPLDNVPEGTPVSEDVARHTVACGGLASWGYSFAVVA